MGYEYDNNVSRNGITRQEFEQKLDKQLEKMSDKKQAEYKQKATSIFDKFAGLNGDANILDESEQIQARAALQSLDANENGKIGRRELKKGKKGSETQKTFAEAGYKATKHFMEAIGQSIIDEAEEDIGEVQYGDADENGESDVTVHYNETTPTTKDDDLKSYHLDNENRIVEKADIEQEQTNIYEDDDKKPYVIDDVVDKVTHGLPPESEIDNTAPPTPLAPKPLTDDGIKMGFFQYITQDKDFTGKLINNETMDLPDGCKLIQGVGIEFDGKTYKMRGGFEDAKDILRFECDETKKTLQQALAEKESNDTVHRYHNHGDTVNEQSTYDAKKGTISHGNDETAVSQTQTFASMLMNNAENTTLRLDEQKSRNGNTITTGETILNTINTDSDDGISMQELISYLNAAKNEANAVRNKTGARKYAGGVDIDAKDLVNIGKVFKKYAGNDGKLQKTELQKLLDNLKSNSMTKLATGNDTYIGETKLLDGNRKRKVKDNANDKGYGENQEYYYNNGVRTAIKDDKVKDADGKETEVKVEDNDGNIAQAGHSSLFKKRFIYIQDLEKEVNAKVLERTVDGQENQQIVRVKDKDNDKSYYRVVTNSDGSYKLGEQLILKTTKGKNTFVSKTEFEKDIKTKLGLPENAILPTNISGAYSSDGQIEYTLNGGKCSANIAKVYIIRHNTQLKKDIPDKNQTIEIKPKEQQKTPEPENQMPKEINKKFRKQIREMADTAIAPMIRPENNGGYKVHRPFKNYISSKAFKRVKNENVTYEERRTLSIDQEIYNALSLRSKKDLTDVEKQFMVDHEKAMFNFLQGRPLNTPYISPNNKVEINKLAKEKGYRETFGSKHGWYYSEKEKMHYKWNAKTQKFEKHPEVSMIDENGYDVYKKDR